MFADLNSNQQAPTRVTLKDTDAVVCDECKNTTFTEAMMMRKASRLLTGAPKDSYIPIPTFVCTSCGHVNDEFIPVELKTTQTPSLVAVR